MSARHAIAVAALALTSLVPAPARAQAPSAKDAYEAATAAFAAKHYAEAASGFARADALEPNPVALESALKAVLLADDPVLGMELVTRADARPAEARIDPLKARARAAFEKRVGRVELRCGENKTCFARVEPGGRALEATRAGWFPVGSIVASITSDAGTSSQSLTVEPGAVVVVVAPSPPAPAPAASTPPAEPTAAPASSSPPAALAPTAATPPPAPPVQSAQPSSGISPVFFVIGAIATGGLAAGTIASGVDTLGLHDDYLGGDDAALEPGQSAQTRTNILLGVTLGVAAATTILAFVTDWGGGDVASARGAELRVRF